MTLHKDPSRGKCPLRLALFPLIRMWNPDITQDYVLCDPDCALYRRGTRYWELEKRVEPFEECAINVIAESCEQQVQKTFSLQQEVAEVKNIQALKALVEMDHANQVAPNDLLRVATKTLVGNSESKPKLIG